MPTRTTAFAALAAFAFAFAAVPGGFGRHAQDGEQGLDRFGRQQRRPAERDQPGRREEQHALRPRGRAGPGDHREEGHVEEDVTAGAPPGALAPELDSNQRRSVNSRLLYQLSYLGSRGCRGISKPAGAGNRPRGVVPRTRLGERRAGGSTDARKQARSRARAGRRARSMRCGGIVDAPDSKSVPQGVSVRPRPPAPPRREVANR